MSTATKKPPLQRSKVTGFRADNFGDIVVIDHADVQIRSETYTVLIVADGATTFVITCAPRTKDSHETAQCLMEWMDRFHCIPNKLTADMAYQSTELHYFFRRFDIKPLSTGLIHHGLTVQRQLFEFCLRPRFMIFVHKSELLQS